MDTSRFFASRAWARASRFATWIFWFSTARFAASARTASMSRGGALRGTGGRGRSPPGLAVRGAAARRRRARRAGSRAAAASPTTPTAPRGQGLLAPPSLRSRPRALELARRDGARRGDADAALGDGASWDRGDGGGRASWRGRGGGVRGEAPERLGRRLDATGRSRFDSTTIDGAPLVPMAQIGAPMIIVGWRAAADDTGARDGGRTPVPAPERLGSPSENGKASW
ncbi:phosphatase [Aureococcus anophagefferens]|nr:phosphatase [Aureococcus anophagefferens]